MFLRAWDTIRGLLLGEKVEMVVFGIPGSPHGRWFGFHGEIFCLSWYVALGGCFFRCLVDRLFVIYPFAERSCKILATEASVLM